MKCFRHIVYIFHLDISVSGALRTIFIFDLCLFITLPDDEPVTLAISSLNGSFAVLNYRPWQYSFDKEMSTADQYCKQCQALLLD